MPTRHASCYCGQLTAQVVGEPVRISICHCTDCQRRTGSVFGEQARFPRENVTVTGVFTEHHRINDEGVKATFRFCPKCGSTICYEREGLEGFVVIPVGAFGDPNFPTPTVSVWEDDKHRWVVPPPEAEHFA